MNKHLLLPTVAAAFALASSASADILSFTASQDTFVRLDGPNNAYGADTTLLVGGHATVGPFNSFYKFENLNLSALSGATINSVTLRLTSVNSAGAGTVNINLYQLSAANADWKEGTSGIVPTGTSDTGATFNNKSGQGASAVTWASGNTNANFVAGTDYVNTVLGNYSGATNTGTGGESFNFGNAALKDLIASSIGGSVSFNFLLRDQTGGTNFLRIASSENTSYAGPQLIIDYVAIPEPSTFAALAGLGVLGLAAARRRRA